MTSQLHPFHLAVPVHDLDAARSFYGDILGCRSGRASDHSIVWDLFGHQVVTHLVPGHTGMDAGANSVDKHQVPVPHFGIVFPYDEWKELADRLQGKVEFVIAPDIRYQGTTGEQGTMFFRDCSGNAVEFKGFKDRDAQMFAPFDK